MRFLSSQIILAFFPLIVRIKIALHQKGVLRSVSKIECYFQIHLSQNSRCKFSFSQEFQRVPMSQRTGKEGEIYKGCTNRPKSVIFVPHTHPHLLAKEMREMETQLENMTRYRLKSCCERGLPARNNYPQV